ncbi:hypothetical protein NL676_017878 [Syzygium grande]|nr:hypothetical protein NL676_017878 [Syzygium grande]
MRSTQNQVEELRWRCAACEAAVARSFDATCLVPVSGGPPKCRGALNTTARIGEAPPLGLDSGIENPDYDVVRIIGTQPEAGALGEAEEVRGPGWCGGGGCGPGRRRGPRGRGGGPRPGGAVRRGPAKLPGGGSVSVEDPGKEGLRVGGNGGGRSTSGGGWRDEGQEDEE